MNGEGLIRIGLDGLTQLSADHGFDASDAESGLYPALYGRDSLWVLLLLQQAAELRADARVTQTLTTAGPRILSSLARLQGTLVDDTIEEQPGRIPHEYHLKPTPHATAMALPLRDGLSYGGFDETFLFVLARDAFARAHPGHRVLAEVDPSVDAALRWIDEYADDDGDGLFEYARRNPANLLNQVWKDSFDSATHTGFDVPVQPLAWLEVQAYAYAVFGTPRIHDGPGSAPHATARDARRAEDLRRAVDQRFWLGPNEGYAMALDGRKAPIVMVASNPGHALWAGLVPGERAESLIGRMTRPDLMSAYGLRTLSTESPLHAPFAYHRGSVWPFDNAIFALGLLQYGRADLAVKVARSVGRAITRAGTPVECYVALEPQTVLEPRSGPVLCWHRWPVRNRVHASTAAGLVVLGSILEVVDG